MSNLQPCKGCARHVRATDDACPFCGAPILHRDVRPQLSGGRLTRAAVFAGAIGAIGACEKSTEPAEPQTPPVTQPPSIDASTGAARPDPTASAVADASIPDASIPDASIPDASTPDAAPKKRRRPKPDAAVAVPIPHPLPKPYGAPPARRRLV